MFDSLKSIFKRTKSKSVSIAPIKIALNGQGLLALLRDCATEIYDQRHIFCRKYLLPFISPLNEFLREKMDIRIAEINGERYRAGQIENILEREVSDQEGFIWMILQLWYPYLTAEMSNNYDSVKFFRVEVHLLMELLLSALEGLYGKYEPINPEHDGVLHSRRFRLRLLEAITDSYEFQKIKTLFVKLSKVGCGVNGDFTPSQVHLTAIELNHLIRFSDIPAPFHQSIGMMLDFYGEYRIQRKVELLVQVVEKAREEILEYRQFFQLGNTVIGSDQIMPVINFICEKTGKNIFASIQYIRALLGGGKMYSEEECQKNLKEIASHADYCVDLVESMSSIYCHASRMG